MHEATTSAALVRAACAFGASQAATGLPITHRETTRVADQNARRLSRSATFTDSTVAAGGRAERRF